MSDDEERARWKQIFKAVAAVILRCDVLLLADKLSVLYKSHAHCSPASAAADAVAAAVVAGIVCLLWRAHLYYLRIPPDSSAIGNGSNGSSSNRFRLRRRQKIMRNIMKRFLFRLTVARPACV